MSKRGFAGVLDVSCHAWAVTCKPFLMKINENKLLRFFSSFFPPKSFRRITMVSFQKAFGDKQLFLARMSSGSCPMKHRNSFKVFLPFTTFIHLFINPSGTIKLTSKHMFNKENAKSMLLLFVTLKNCFGPVLRVLQCPAIVLVPKSKILQVSI